MKMKILACLLLVGFVTFAQGHKLELTVSGIEVKAGGSLQAGLFNDPDTKWEPKSSFRSKRVKVSQGTMTLSFEDVPEGTYAVAVFHDIDDNKWIKRNFFTIPKEPVGFSNGQRIKLGAPGFEKCSFQFRSDTVKEIVLVKY